MRYPRLAFVDVETTGLGAGHHRVAEVGVVTIDEGGVQEWGTLIDPGRRTARADYEFNGESAPIRNGKEKVSDAPRFSEIAGELASRLDGRLFIAHNARFDFAFLKSEFDRLAIPFKPQVLCTVMLSRKLYPQHDRHNLDAIMERYGLSAEERHRALPDARVLYQFWQTVHGDFSADRVADTVDSLLAEPLLPAHLNLDLIDALPERPGVYVFHGDGDRPLLLGRAGNLRRHVKRYFQLDRNCSRANALSNQIRNIRWQTAEGAMDARLREIAMRRELFSPTHAGRHSAISIRINPSAAPVAKLVSLAEPLPQGADLFGIFGTERKAKNALRKLATVRGVCHLLLGLPEQTPVGCRECAPAGYGAGNVCQQDRPRHLLRFLTAIAPLKLQAWPYRGPIAIREKRSVHVFDQWEHLGTVRTGSDIPAVLKTRHRGFDPDIFNLLRHMIPRLGARALRNIPIPTDAQRGTEPDEA